MTSSVKSGLDTRCPQLYYPQMECVAILHNIRSIHNVGSIFRTADGAGVSKLYLTGYTPAPVDRFRRPRQDLAKVALGAEQSVPWEHTADLKETIENLKQQHFLVLALEQHPNSVSIFDFHLSPTQQKIALVLGSEVGGLSEQDLALADHTLEIPMHGSKESLNVSVAAGIALYGLRRSRP